MIMVRYGKIEDGILRTQDVEERKERFPEEVNGLTVIRERTVTIEEQTDVLSQQGWKPVDDIDESELECEEGFVILITAVEYEDHIGYEYDKTVDRQYYRKKINELKEQLASTDYQVIKCYEASMVGDQMPYDINALHSERQYKRDSINALEDMLDNILNGDNANDNGTGD